MIVKLQSGDKIKIESDERREARRKYKEYSLLSIGLKLKSGQKVTINKQVPTINVRPIRLELDTYYPTNKDFPIGHSELTVEDYHDNGDPMLLEISKYPDEDDYNLVTNNCSDATRCALEKLTGKKMNPFLFTTPGDTLDFFRKNFDARKDKNLKDRLHNRYYTNISKLQLEDLKLMPSVYYYFEKGSKIHIKKKNRGKFTAYCGGNVTSACIAKAKASGNPTLVKRATFAANARKWKHLYGGTLLSNVDNRTDTTRKGSHEGLPAWGAADALNNAGLWDLLNYNITGNPYIITGAPDILPGKIGTIKKSIQSVASINDKGLNVTKKLNTSVKNGLTYEDFDVRHVNAGRNKYTKALRERALYMITNSYPNSIWYKLLQDILKKLAKKEAIGGDVKKFKKQRYDVLDNFINSGFFR